MRVSFSVFDETGGEGISTFSIEICTSAFSVGDLVGATELETLG